MTRLALCTAWIVLAGTLPAPGQEESSAGSAAGAPGTEVVPSARAEYYVLERPVADVERLEPAGLLVLERAEGLLELQAHFAEGDLHVHHVEIVDALERRLVWREYGAQALRTWVAVETAGEPGLEITSWGLGEPTRQHVQSQVPVRFPLASIEALRRGEDVRELVRAWPLSSGLEVLTVRRLDPAAAALPRGWKPHLENRDTSELRAFQLVRADGTAAESLLFDGDALLAIELQPGGTCGRLVEADRAQELLARFARSPDETDRQEPSDDPLQMLRAER